MTDIDAGAAAPEAGAAEPGIRILAQFIRDLSFENPRAPQSLIEQTQPQLQLNLAQKVQTLGEGVFEVVLTVTLTCTLNAKTAYLAEVAQAGIDHFEIARKMNLAHR